MLIWPARLDSLDKSCATDFKNKTKKSKIKTSASFFEK
jgi:hypothetical protein